MLEINRKNSLGEIQRVKNNETIVAFSPCDETIRGGIIHHLICLHNKRRNYVCFLHIKYNFRVNSDGGKTVAVAGGAEVGTVAINGVKCDGEGNKN